ncbi:MAG: hypothetical protein R2867_47630 [Caldilineaceae bacterium]
MQKKLALTHVEKVYTDPTRFSVPLSDLDATYAEMAKDTEREAEALAWVDALVRRCDR